MSKDSNFNPYDLNHIARLRKEIEKKRILNKLAEKELIKRKKLNH